MASGVYDLKLRLQHNNKELHNCESIHTLLDQFYMSRVGIRLLIAQHLALGEACDTADVKSLRAGYIGLICQNTSPTEIAHHAIHDATILCDRTLGVAPHVRVVGETKLALPYLPSHLHHVIFELLKNSMKATVDFHSLGGKVAVDADSLPPVQIMIADGHKQNDVCIKISDCGGGIPRSKTQRVFDYFYTTGKPQFENLDGTAFGVNSPLCGLGYGLPLSRMYTRYFGGDLKLVSMENMGTDVFIYLKKAGNNKEPLTSTLYK